MELRRKIWVSMAVTATVQALFVAFVSAATGIPIISLFVLLLIFWFFQWLIGPFLIARGTHQITAADPNYGWLHSMVKELADRAGMATPRVYVSDEEYPNAYAFGNSLRRGVAFTRPLLQILNQDELRAVASHELGHLRHHDVEIGIAFSLIPTILYRAGWFIRTVAATLAERPYYLAALGAAIVYVVGLIVTGIGFLLDLFALWLNRLREMYADHHAVELLNKEASSLATALAKMEVYVANAKVDPVKGMVLTVPPEKIKSTDPNELLKSWLNEEPGALSDITLTHPHTSKRVKMILRETGTLPG